MPGAKAHLNSAATMGDGRTSRGTHVDGLYVLDMVAHNNDHDRDVFQICPGAGRQAMWLAEQAHLANQIGTLGAPLGTAAQRRGQPAAGSAVPTA